MPAGATTRDFLSFRGRRSATISELFEHQVKRSPTRIAGVFGEKTLTYSELDRRANRLARRLRHDGVAPESKVALHLEPSADLVTALLAVLKAGAAYVPLDPYPPEERLRYVLEDSGASHLVTCRRLRDQLPALRIRTVDLDRDARAIGRESGADPHRRVSDLRLAYVLYTSGSTGRPKGVAITQRSVVSFLRSMGSRPGLGAADILLSVSPITFDISVLEIFLPLVTGACLVLPERRKTIDGRLLRTELEGSGATVMQATPATWQLLVDAGWRGDSRLKALCGGERLPPRLAQELLERCGEVWNLYGPTETTIWSACHEVRTVDGEIPIGGPIGHTELHVLDSRGLPVAPGTPGRLFIGGRGLARAYHGRPRRTAELFVPDPLGPRTGDRLYDTGDRAVRRAGGELDFLGRADHQVKVRGFRVELREVEAVLAEHPVVAQSAVAMCPGPSGDARLAAYVVPAAQSDSDPSRTSWQDGQVSQWARVWDEAFSDPRGEPDPDFAVSGWESSYTSLPISAGEMEEWVANAVSRIRAPGPRRILELGCGTGLLLWRLAPHCEAFCGTDVSRRALDFLRRRLEAEPRPGGAETTLLERGADDFSGWDGTPFDAVVVNSVAQYFPSMDYLIRVVEGAVRVVEPGGFVFLGDLRSRPLHPALCASVELYRAGASLSLEELRRRVRRRRNQEEELIIDPELFAELGRRLPRVRSVAVELKQGRLLNEFARFRYDVTLTVGDSPGASRVEPRRLEWHEGLGPDEVARLLCRREPASLRLMGVLNPRVRTELLTAKLVEAGGEGSAGELRHEIREAAVPASFDPEDFRRLVEQVPYRVSVTWSAVDVGSYDVLFEHCEAAGHENHIVPLRAAEPHRPWSDYGNPPLRGQLARDLAPRLRRHLERRLPDYMRPSAFLFLESLPVTPSGKTDRRALPAPDWTRPVPAGTYVEPRTPTEERLAEIWAAVLDVERVGLHDHYFDDLGGHSLLAVRLFSEIERATGRRLHLSILLEAPTVESMARLLERERPGFDAREPSAERALVTIWEDGSRPPFFAVHGGGYSVLFYRGLAHQLGADQPFYAFQPVGHDRVEAMAAHYIEEMRTVQEEGPYRIGGLSFGGMVAFEMARQLHEEGEDVALLALLDTHGPGYPRYLPSTTRLERAVDRFLRIYVHHHMRNLWLLKGSERWDYFLDKARTALRRGRQRIRRRKKAVLTSVYRFLGRGVPENLRSHPGAIREALHHYVPRFYPGRVTLLRASRQPRGIHPDPTLGWGNLCGELDIREFTGTHAVTGPAAGEVARLLRAGLDADP